MLRITVRRLFTALHFLVVFSIVAPADRIARELDASAKERLDWVGARIEINRGAVDIFGKKLNPRFSRDGKFPLVERRQKCHHLDNGMIACRCITDMCSDS